MWTALGVVYVVWGSTYLAIRSLVGTIPPLLGAGIRFGVAGPVLLAAVAVTAGRGAFRITGRQAGAAVLAGLLMAGGGQGLLTIAETKVSSGLAALLVAVVPLYVLVLRRLLGERPPKVTAAGVALGLAGLAALLLLGGPAGGAHGTAWWAPPLVLLAALSWASGTVASTRVKMPSNPFTTAGIELTAAGAALSVTGLAGGQRLVFAEVSTASWFALGYLIVAGSLIGYSAYVFVLGRLPLSTVATYAYVNPVIAVVLGVLFADERFGAAQLGGALLVLAAVAVVVRAERAPEPKLSVGAGTMR